jgi:hypothetical protein
MLWKSTADPKLGQCGTAYAVRPCSAGTQCQRPLALFTTGTMALLLRMVMHPCLRSGGVPQTEKIPAYSSGWPSPGLDDLNATSDDAEI